MESSRHRSAEESRRGASPHGLASAAAALCLFGIFLLGAAAPAVAIDEIGLFFDSDGIESCLQTSPYSNIAVYLILLDPSATSGVSGWECSLELRDVVLTGVTLMGGGTNFDNQGSELDFIVGIGTLNPLPASRAVQLARLTVLYLNTPAAFFIHPYLIPSLDEGTPVYADGATASLLPLTPRVVGAGGIAAGINLPACLPEEATWGAVKHSYE